MSDQRGEYAAKYRIDRHCSVALVGFGTALDVLAVLGRACPSVLDIDGGRLHALECKSEAPCTRSVTTLGTLLSCLKVDRDPWQDCVGCVRNGPLHPALPRDECARCASSWGRDSLERTASFVWTWAAHLGLPACLRAARAKPRSLARSHPRRTCPPRRHRKEGNGRSREDSQPWT